jgi:hypothetical protein
MLVELAGDDELGKRPTKKTISVRFIAAATMEGREFHVHASMRTNQQRRKKQYAPLGLNLEKALHSRAKSTVKRSHQD